MQILTLVVNFPFIFNFLSFSTPFRSDYLEYRGECKQLVKGRARAFHSKCLIGYEESGHNGRFDSRGSSLARNQLLSIKTYKAMEENQKRVHRFTLRQFEGNQFEVNVEWVHFTVDLETKLCFCGLWQEMA